MEEFLEGFSPDNLVGNDRMVGDQVCRLLVQDLNAMPLNQSCIGHVFVVIRELKKHTTWKRYVCLLVHK